MIEFDIYNDIAKRTNGDIYVGVVGPVRSGKSTFISKFMSELIIPNISENKKSVAIDELPQSASGKTIMTTEPKFIPASAVEVDFDGAKAKVKFIDCVGYLVDGAIGHEENDKIRLVKTPWFDEDIPFDKASEIGTRKVIAEHSTVGVVVTTDGSFTDISRDSYKKAEEKVVSELKALKKPFIVIFNTQNPNSQKAQAEKRALEEKYGVTVLCENVENMDKGKLVNVLKSLLLEFPLRSFDINLPEWMQVLPPSNRLIATLLDEIKACSKNISSMKSFELIENSFINSQSFNPATDVSLDMARGRASLSVSAKNGVFYKVLSDECGETVENELQLLNYVKSLTEAKQNYTKLKNALQTAESTGYGVVMPMFEETTLDEPEVVKKTGGYSVRMKAKAKSLHIIRADVETEVNPVYGSKQQCDDFCDMLKNADDEACWDTGVFGKPLREIIADEVSQTSSSLGDNVKFKIRKTLTKAVNEKKSNLFCILI